MKIIAPTADNTQNLIVKKWIVRFGKYIYGGMLISLILPFNFFITRANADDTKFPSHQLQTILDNTAAYCEKLKTAAFQYTCTEKVVETIETSIQSKTINRDLSRFLRRGWITPYRDGTDNNRGARNEFVSQYQAIQQDNQTREQRLLLEHNGKKILKENASLNTIIYSPNAFLAPLFLFDKQNRDKFEYKLLKNDKTMNRDAYVIEMRLHNGEEEKPVFAKAWIDAGDFSVLKFEAFPDSFQGYDSLAKTVAQNTGNIKIKDIHYFGYNRDGIRFPSSTKITITYTENKSIPGKDPDLKEQSLTKITSSFSYKKYKFFNVTVEAPIFANLPKIQVKEEQLEPKPPENETKENIMPVQEAVSASLPGPEPLKYDVSVEAMAVPLFVVDSAGNPVLDLKQEELQVFANGRPMEIIYFNRFEFAYDTETAATQNIAEDKKAPALKLPDRIIFIIIDSVFNSASGLRRSKKIARDLIREGTHGERFILLENTPAGGLKYMAGPSSDSDKLVKGIDKITPNHTIWKQLKDIRENNLINVQQWVGIDHIPSPDRRDSGELEPAYKNMAIRFSHVLSQFQYALKTITQPKIVFLISEGISNMAFNEEYSEGKFFVKPFLFNYVKDIVRAVNTGGSVLYTINPQDNAAAIAEGVSGEMSLRNLAEESGGKYFEGSDPGIVIKNIKKTIAAYYELVFPIPPQLGDNITLTVKCSRKDARLHTLTHTERNKPYQKMAPMQKKIFALDVATGGGWSRMTGTVAAAKYNKVKQEKNECVLAVELPGEMINLKLDIFLLDIDPDTEVDMNFETREVKGRLELKMNLQKNKKQFFVIIKPISLWCLYNEVK
ncbi:MAG: hypothetical protein NT166_07155 [Candidatus Aminicenantes bacterium]|nr:hypothetical protein [Candidatus Aminicenantes bacterium]